ELLPNQTRKVPYNDGRIKQCIGRIQNGTNEAIDPRLDKLPIVEWLGQLSENDERLAIIQQSDVFADHYFEFSLDIRCEPPYKMARRMPFLINAEGPVALRPLSFLEPGANPTASATI